MHIHLKYYDHQPIDEDDDWWDWGVYVDVDGEPVVFPPPYYDARYPPKISFMDTIDVYLYVLKTYFNEDLEELREIYQDNFEDFLDMKLDGYGVSITEESEKIGGWYNE